MPEFEYVLEREQVRNALYLCGALKSRKVINIVETVILSVLIIISVINIIINPSYSQNYFITVVLVFMLVMVLGFSGKQEKETLDNAANGCTIRLTLNEADSEITVFVAQSGARWQINRDNLLKCFESDELYVLLLNDNRIVVIPKNAPTAETLAVLNRITDSLSLKKIGENIE